jgi:hypothetical protein
VSSLTQGDPHCWELYAHLELRPACQHGHVHGFDQLQGGCESSPSSGLCRRGDGLLTTPGGIKGCLHRSTSPRSGFGQLTALLSSRTEGSYKSPSRSEAVYSAPAPLVSKWA